MKLLIFGLIALIFLSSGCVGNNINYDDVANSKTIIITSVTEKTCCVSVNGVIKTYEIPNVESIVPIEGLKEGSNYIIVTCGEQVVEFDLDVPISEGKEKEEYDTYNRNYWKLRLVKG